MPSGLPVSHSIVAVNPDEVGNRLGELLDREVLAAPDVDRLRGVVGVQEHEPCLGELVDVQELQARRLCQWGWISGHEAAWNRLAAGADLDTSVVGVSGAVERASSPIADPDAHTAAGEVVGNGPGSCGGQ